MSSGVKLFYKPYEISDERGKRVRLSEKARLEIVRTELSKLNLTDIKRLIDSGVPRFYHPVSGVLLSAEGSKNAAFYAYKNLVVNYKNNLDDMRVLQLLNLILLDYQHMGGVDIT